MRPALNRPLIHGVILTLALISLPATTRANVYATNLRLNDSTSNVVLVAGETLSISYLLNEDASAGVTIRIFADTNVVRILSIAGGEAGTSRGTNTVIWDGKDDAANPVAGGTYGFSITATTTGYEFWTQITHDTNAGNRVHTPRGLAVNQNTNSHYYGRVYAANSYPGASPTNTADLLGFQKLNADASPAAEGIFSTGGYPWTGAFGQSPFKVRVGADDQFYAEDATGNGVVMGWNQEIATNSLVSVMRNDNNPLGSLFSSFVVTGSGADRKLWMTDVYAGGQGVVRWDFQPDGTLATNDPGTSVIPMSPAGDLNNPPFDAVVDREGRIYVVCPPWQDSQYRLMRFPAYTGTPLTNAEWKVATTTSYDNTYVYALAVDPVSTYVAVAPDPSGAVGIYEAGTGLVVTNLSASGKTAASVAWDNAGNAYVGFEGNTINDLSVWQAWSPPGANKATTFGLGTIHVVAAPSITGQPQSLTNLAGTDATFSVVAGGEEPLMYQWRFNGADLGGATTSVLTLPGVQTNNAGGYEVVITNAIGAVTSAVATLTVWVPPSITQEPESRTVPPGSDASFGVTASGTAPLSYQWRFNGADLANATSNTLTLTGVQTTNAGSYDVVVTNVAGATTSAVAVLTVSAVQEPIITGIVPMGSKFKITFTGPAEDPPTAYTVLSGPDVMSVTNVTPAIITGGNGVYEAIVPSAGTGQFYRIIRSPSPPQPTQPYITSITPVGSNFKITFTGPAEDPPTAYTVLSGPDLASVTNVTTATITGEDGGYEAIVPANGPRQFYRIRRSTSPPPPTQPYITSITAVGSNFKITFTGPAEDPPTAYTVLSGPDVMSVTNVTAATITGGNGVYEAIVPADGAGRFYRIIRLTTPPTPAPRITRMVPIGAEYQITFTGPAADPPTAYAVLSSPEPTVVTNLATAVITGSNGVYQATVAASGPRQFYRIKRTAAP